MKMILVDGTELNPIIVTGETRYVQGANRDALTFVFGESMSLDEMDALFNTVNCESIKLYSVEEIPVDETGTEMKTIEVEHIHTGYVVRVDIRKTREIIEPGTATTEEVVEHRVEVTMAQRTYAESQVASLTETVDYLVLESLLA